MDQKHLAQKRWIEMKIPSVQPEIDWKDPRIHRHKQRTLQPDRLLLVLFPSGAGGSRILSSMDLRRLIQTIRDRACSGICRLKFGSNESTVVVGKVHLDDDGKGR